MKKLFIFDFDGTLYNTMYDVAKCFNKALKQLNLPVRTYNEYEQMMGGNINEVISNVLGSNLNSKENIDNVRTTYENIYLNDEKENSKPYNGIREMLLTLQENNAILSINSNRKTYMINKYNKQYLNDVNFFDVRGYNPNTPHKPDPFDVLELIKNANVKKEETLFIGDTSTDIMTARNAGVDLVLVDWGQANNNDLNNEYVLKVISKPSELYDFINP